MRDEIRKAGKKFGEEVTRLWHSTPPGFKILGILGIGGVVVGVSHLLELDTMVGNWFDPSAAELHHKAIDTSLFEQLKKDHFDFDDAGMRAQILSSNGFDVTRPNGAEEHWEVKFNEDGTVKDVDMIPGHHFGTGPIYLENDESKVDHWSWGNTEYDRHLSDDDYAAAKTYFESHGSHLYKAGEHVSTGKLQAILTGFKQHGINSHEVNQIIRKYGGLVDENGAAFEIWMTDKGPVMHQVPAHLRPNFPHLTPDGFWKSGAGAPIELKAEK